MTVCVDMTYTDPHQTIFRGPTKGHEAAHRCEVCHAPVQQRPGPGRRKMRHEECKAFDDAYRAFDRALVRLIRSGRLTYALTRDLRGRLWSCANQLNTIGDDRARLRAFEAMRLPPIDQVSGRIPPR